MFITYWGFSNAIQYSKTSLYHFLSTQQAADTLCIYLFFCSVITRTMLKAELCDHLDSFEEDMNWFIHSVLHSRDELPAEEHYPVFVLFPHALISSFSFFLFWNDMEEHSLLLPFANKTLNTNACAQKKAHILKKCEMKKLFKMLSWSNPPPTC